MLHRISCLLNCIKFVFSLIDCIYDGLTKSKCNKKNALCLIRNHSAAHVPKNVLLLLLSLLFAVCFIAGACAPESVDYFASGYCPNSHFMGPADERLSDFQLFLLAGPMMPGRVIPCWQSSPHF